MILRGFEEGMSIMMEFVEGMMPGWWDEVDTGETSSRLFEDVKFRRN